MKLMNNLIVLPMIICLLGCPMACSPAPVDDDDSSGDDDDSAVGDDDDDSAEGIIFMDEGQIVEENDPINFFKNPESDRLQLFLSQILTHDE